MNQFKNIPPQKLSFRKKNKEWRKKHIDWATNFLLGYSNAIDKTIKKNITNYNLVNGILDMKDMVLCLNPNQLSASFIPDNIQHYPIINSKLNVLAGEESKRRMDWRVLVTNPEAISEIETRSKEQWMKDLSDWITKGSQDEEEAQQELEKIEQYNKYEWQDVKEMWGNEILKHYMKELSMPDKFNAGFYDAMIVAKEVYQCEVVGGEPTMERINPNKMIVLKSSSSNKIEDADVIILWDYWSPGKIIDTYYDVLSSKDMDYINDLPFNNSTDDMQNIDPRVGFKVIADEGVVDLTPDAGGIIESIFKDNNISLGSDYVDYNGNIRVVRLYWKSFRKILKVKSYNLETGEEEYNFYPENYQINKQLGEESETLWINEAWEGTKIGDKIYVNMRPKVIQYNRMSNPSRCHFGIIGSVYNRNEGMPYSLVDMAKPYNYMYDIIHDRLNKKLAASWGTLVVLDFAQIPDKWDVDKWMYYAKTAGIAVKDSFKEGNRGAAQGKLAGGLNNQSSGVIDADLGDSIQHDINLLTFIKMEMAEVMGISPQREGQVSNRETVGGVERSVLQSSHITEWLFMVHEDIKKRVLECFLETAKAAFKGKSLKFRHLTTDGAIKLMEVDGNEFAEADYGLVVDNSDATQNFVQKMEAYAQALIQNQMVTTSTLLKLWNGSSISDIARSIENDEKVIKEQNAQAQQAQQEQFQAELEAKAALEQQKLALEEQKNIRDNETKIAVEQMKILAAQEAKDYENETIDPLKKAELEEKIRQYNEKIKLEQNKFLEQKNQNREQNKLTEKEIKVQEKYLSKKNKQ